jgi:hypothetical protein
MSKTAYLIVGSVCLICIPFACLKAAEGDCDPANLSKTGPVVTGTSRDGLTQRCLRRVAEGIQVTCDSREVAVSVFCESNGSTSGRLAALVTSGIPGSRTGVCLWSSEVDANIIVMCKAIACKKNQSKGDASGDVYTKYGHVPQ